MSDKQQIQQDLTEEWPVLLQRVSAKRDTNIIKACIYINILHAIKFHEQKRGNAKEKNCSVISGAIIYVPPSPTYTLLLGAFAKLRKGF
jgi:hypothetical protein